MASDSRLAGLGGFASDSSWGHASRLGFGRGRSLSNVTLMCWLLSGRAAWFIAIWPEQVQGLPNGNAHYDWDSFSLIPYGSCSPPSLIK